MKTLEETSSYCLKVAQSIKDRAVLELGQFNSRTYALNIILCYDFVSVNIKKKGVKYFHCYFEISSISHLEKLVKIC